MNRRTLVNLVFFAGVFVLMIFWAVGNLVTIDAIEHPYDIEAEFEASSGILPNAEVAYLGVNFGRVMHVERMPGGVKVTMRIDNGNQIPEGSIARIFRKSAVGEPYIDFLPPDGYAGKGPFIDEGDVVPMADTRIPLEFSEFLRSASDLIGNIDAEAAGTLVHELALALEGRGESLRQIIVSSDQLAAEFAARTDVLDRLATNSTRLTSVVAEHRGSLGTALTNLSLITESLRNADGNTRILLERGTAFVGTTADLVAGAKNDLDCLLHDLVPVIQTAGERQRLLNTAELIDTGGDAFGLLWNTRDIEPDGVWIRVNLLIEFGSPATQYVPPRPLPPVPAVPACPLSLTSASPDFVPGNVVGGSGGGGVLPTLPATGGTALLGLAALLVVAAGVARIVGRSRHARD